MKLSFKGLARFVTRRPGTVLSLILATTIILGFGMANMHVDVDMTDDIPASMPEKAFYDEVGKIFPSDDFLIVAITDAHGAFAPETLRQVKEWSDALAEVDGVKNVISISSAGLITGTEAGLAIEQAMPVLPETAEEIAAFRERVRTNQMTGSLLGGDGLSTAILITLKGGIDAEKLVRVRISAPAGSTLDDNFIKAIGQDARIYRSASEEERTAAYLAFGEDLDPSGMDSANSNSATQDSVIALVAPPVGGDAEGFVVAAQAAAKARGWKAKALISPFTGYQRVMAAIDSLPTYVDGQVYVSGAKAVSSIVGKLLITDLALLFPVVIVLIAFILFLSFRTLRGVLLPLGNVVLSVIWAMGLMGLLGQAITMATMILPIILIAVGTAYTIHVINRFYEDLAHYGDKSQAIEKTISTVAVPVFLAGGTTVIGFGSLATSSLDAMRMFGILSALGIFFALVLSLTFTPAVLRLLPVPKQRTVKAHESSGLAEMLASLGRMVSRQPKTIVAVTAIALVGFGVFIPRVGFETNTINSFKEGSGIRTASEYLNDNFTGITVMTVIVRTDEDGAILDPAVLKAMDGLQIRLESLRLANGRVVAPEDPLWSSGSVIVGGSQSIVTFVKGINKALNADDPAFDKVPEEFTEVPVTTERYSMEDGSLVERDSDTLEFLASFGPGEFRTEGSYAFIDLGGTERRIDLSAGEAVDLIKGRDYAGQLVFQYENSGDPENIEGFIDNPRRTARMNIFIKTASSTLMGQIQQFARSYIAQEFPEGFRADITGLSNLTLAVLRLLVNSQISSVIASLVIIFIFVSLVSRSFVEGLFSVIPLTASLGINFGVMGLFGIPIDITTATIASIAIGIGIDYTLHFLERLKLMVCGMELPKAIEATMRTTGKGIFFNALAVAGGFSALLFSQLKGNIYMGLLMALIMVTSSLFAMTLLPALLTIFKPVFIGRKANEAHCQEEPVFEPVQ